MAKRGPKRTQLLECREDDCTARTHAKNMCFKHYYRDYRASDPSRTEAQTKHAVVRKYNITVEQYDAQNAYQHGLCAICGNEDDHRRLSVDHDHKCCPGIRTCGKCNRGLLCESCNVAIGRFNDDVKTMARAIAYLSGGGVWQWRA